MQKKTKVRSSAAAARRTEYLYKEYVRLSEVQQVYMKSSFDDFKMLSAVGSVIGLVITVATFISKAGADFAQHQARLGELSFVAFLGMLALVAILAFRDLLKQSLIGGLTVHLTQLESALRARMKLEKTEVFRVAATADRWVKQQHRYVALVFHVVFYLALGGIPVTVLILFGAGGLACIFSLVAGVLFIIHTLAAGLLGRFKLEAAQK